MRAGFAKNDITPRVGVEMAGFGPFLCRKSIGIRDQLWARAMAVESNDGGRAVLVSCDLVGVTRDTARKARALVEEHTGLPGEAVCICCSHTHSGPSTCFTIGWGEADAVYVEMLPARIAKACVDALGRLQDVEFGHAVVPCEGVGLNREYDRDGPPLEEVLQPDWRPAKPELTDTVCHVITAKSEGQLTGFISYFGCHPVCCCQLTRYIHGDYAGVATNLLERERPGAVGLFLQGANGDVNSCCVHKPEQEALLALDIVAGRYANAVRKGLAETEPFDAEPLAYVSREVDFPRKPYELDALHEMLREREGRLHALDVRDLPGREGLDLRMDTVWAAALRRIIGRIESGERPSDATEVYGLRLGTIRILASGFETFQAVRDEVVKNAQGDVTLVVSVANDTIGYAPDATKAAEGGYASDFVPFLHGNLAHNDLHIHLPAALLELDAALAGQKEK